MKAFVVEKPEVGRLKNIPKPQPQAHEVLIRVKACGICGTDLHILHGEYVASYPIVPGHEIAGIVEEVGDKVEYFSKGDKVVVNPNLSCGKCYYCRRGLVHFCENWKAIGIHINGGYAEYVVVPEANVYKLPNNTSLLEASFAEPLACCIRGQDLANIKLGDRVVVLGLGPIGLLHVQLAKLRGASLIIGIDIVEKRINKAEKLGADIVLNALKCNVVDEVLRITNKKGVDVVIEATGVPKVLKDALKMLDYGGRLLVFGVAPPHAKVEISPYTIFKKEIKILGSFTNPFTTERAVSLITSNRLNFKEIISHVISLNDVPKFLPIVEKEKEKVIKVIITP